MPNSVPASRAWASRAWASRAWASRAWASRAWASRAWASRAWAISMGAFALTAILFAPAAEARIAGHPGATGRANGGTCNRCHSPQIYEGLKIELPIEYRHDCYQPVQGGYQFTNSFYAIPYTPAGASAPPSEINVKLRLTEPPAVDGTTEEVGIFCPTEAQLQPVQECTSPAECTTGDLCKDYGTVLQEVEVYDLPGSCTSGDEQFQIEADCFEEGALCANDSCARRVERAVNTCGQTLPACLTPNWAGFAMEVANLTPPVAGQPALKPAVGETELKQADSNGDEFSLTEVNHAAPREFVDGAITWDLTLVAPRYTNNNAVQNVTLYASANATNHNLAADIGDVTAVAQIPVYFEAPSGQGNTGPDCVEGEVCTGGQVLGDDLLCSCPNGFTLGEPDPATGRATCQSAGFCDCSLGSEKPATLGFALLVGIGLTFRRRQARKR